MSVRARIVMTALAVVTLAVPAVAEAAYPGQNGKIAFVRAGQIWTVNPDGTGAAQLTSDPVMKDEPQWSPDGTRIAYTAGDPLTGGGQQRQIRVMNADGSGDAQLRAPWTYSPTWSPDGSRIAFVAPYFDPQDCACFIYQVVEASLDGSNGHVIAIGEGQPGTGDLGPVYDVEWSPKGDEVAFTDGPPEASVINAASVTDDSFPPSKRWLAGGGCCTTTAAVPAWSPDAGKVAFLFDATGNGPRELYTMNSDRTGLTHLSNLDPAEDVEWSPDGAKLVIASGGLYTANADGSQKTPLTSGGSPDWQPVVTSTGPGYPRPKSATVLRTSLVPAYNTCTSANRTHGPPLAFPSCNPPTQVSPHLTVGTPDANGPAANMDGWLRLKSINGGPPPDDADVRVSLNVTDVRCSTPNPQFLPCSSTANAHPTPDYIGRLTGRIALRLTDRYNLPSPAGSGAGTMTDRPFDVRADCTATPDPTVGSTCSVDTTVSALLPGLEHEGRRSIWQLADVRIFDGGSDGTRQPPNGTLFLRQGIFVP